MGRNHLCEQATPEGPAHLLGKTCDLPRPSGLSFGFPKLSPSRRQLDYVLLARPPLYSPCGFRVRLACLIHAANVRSEPGSNPSLERSVHLNCRFLPARAGRWLSATTQTRCQVQTVQTRSHVFFRGHPECQRSSRTGAFASRARGDQGSDRSAAVKTGLHFSFPATSRSSAALLDGHCKSFLESILWRHGDCGLDRQPAPISFAREATFLGSSRLVLGSGSEPSEEAPPDRPAGGLLARAGKVMPAPLANQGGRGFRPSATRPRQPWRCPPIEFAGPQEASLSAACWCLARPRWIATS